MRRVAKYSNCRSTLPMLGSKLAEDLCKPLDLACTIPMHLTIKARVGVQDPRFADRRRYARVLIRLPHTSIEHHLPERFFERS